jgi:NTE family protein
MESSAGRMSQPEPQPAATDESGAKIGLALSGGGHRAALFHLGVLARLAEVGLLRRVEVISTVSGGSILGALYYLHLKRLLETKTDAEITDADYVEMVRRVEHEFMEGIRKNVRARIFTNLFKNLWMARVSYSRSDRIGDLLDRHLYKPAWPEPRPKRWFGLVEEQIRLDELKITPAGDEHHPFRPDEHNGPRNAKVPVILINATTLNTGHNWRFEVIRMGEPRANDERTRAVAAEVDKNLRLAQGYFEADPDPGGHQAILSRQRTFPLGLAVAASACVPTLFHPLQISKLYPDKTVQLVDGGVHDNQGIQALFDNDCTHLIVSDASGQLGDQNLPATRIPGVAGRSINVYGDRIRDEQLMHASGRQAPMVLCHLRKGMRADVIAPLADDGKPSINVPDAERLGPVRSEDFGVKEEVQGRLAGVRTDLDSFADSESYSLMLDGYLMTNLEVERCTPVKPLVSSDAPASDPTRWAFGAVAPYIGSDSPPQWYGRSLAAARERFMKPLRLEPVFGALVLVLLLAALVLGIIALVVWSDSVANAFENEWPIWWSVVPVVGLILLMILYVKERLPRPFRWIDTLIVSVLLPILFAPILWIVALLTMAFNPLFLWLGRVRD